MSSFVGPGLVAGAAWRGDHGHVFVQAFRAEVDFTRLGNGVTLGVNEHLLKLGRVLPLGEYALADKMCKVDLAFHTVFEAEVQPVAR
jgi:hypothetical protein